MIKALVTGSTGFVGSHIVRALADDGHQVRAFHRPKARLDLIQDLPIEHAPGDVLDRVSLVQAMHGCEWVFHTAAVSDYWRSERLKLYLVNVQGTRYVLEAAREAGVRRVILTSSAAAMGLRADGLPADETMPFNLPPRRFPYGHSKWLAELEAERAIAQHGQDVVMLNPSVIFGPGDLNQISGSMIVEAARGLVPPFYPAGRVTVIDVRDVARAHVAAAERGRTGERYLLGESDVSYRDLWARITHLVGLRRALMLPLPAALTPAVSGGVFVISAILAATRLGVRLPLNADQVWLSGKSICFDCRKARRELGAPQIGLAQSLEDTYRWYAERGLLRR